MKHAALRLSYINHAKGAPSLNLTAADDATELQLPLSSHRVFFNEHGAEVHEFTLQVVDKDPEYRVEYANGAK